MTAQFTIRAMRASDRNFVLATWLKSYRQSSCGGVLPYRYYRQVYTALINSVLERANVLVATAPDDTNAIFGYLVYLPGCGCPGVDDASVVYAFTKQIYRRMGICTALLTAAGFSKPYRHSMRTKDSQYLTGRFDPRPLRQLFREEIGDDNA